MKKTIFIIIGIMLIIALITMMQISGYYNTEKYNEKYFLVIAKLVR